MWDCGRGGSFALRDSHLCNQVPSTVFLQVESAEGPLDVIQGVHELGCCFRLNSLEAESEVEVFVHMD